MPGVQEQRAEERSAGLRGREEEVTEAAEPVDKEAPNDTHAEAGRANVQRRADGGLEAEVKAAAPTIPPALRLVEYALSINNRDALPFVLELLAVVLEEVQQEMA